MIYSVYPHKSQAVVIMRMVRRTDTNKVWFQQNAHLDFAVIRSRRPGDFEFTEPHLRLAAEPEAE